MLCNLVSNTFDCSHWCFVHYNFTRLFIFLGQPSKIAAFSGNGFILNKLKNRPITSTEERIEIEFQTKQSNSSLFCADNDLVFTRLLGPSNYQRLYLLHTQIIVLGGPYKLGDIFQMNSMEIVSDNNFIGFISKNVLIGAEFRNNQLYIIIQKNKQIWFNIKLNSKFNQLSLLHNQYKLQIKYTMIWLINKNNNQSLNDLWPLVKINYDDTIDNWITVGPNNQYSDNNNNNSNDIHLTVLNNEQELKLMKNLKIVNQVYQDIWQNTLWFGRTIYLGGINYTKSIENGLFIPGIQNIHNKYQHFQGCITGVTINGLRLDLQSPFQARIRYLQSIQYEKIHTITKFSLPLKCDNNNVTTEMFSNICSSFDSNKLSCSLNKQYHHPHYHHYYYHHRRERLSNSYLYNFTELKDCELCLVVQYVYFIFFFSNLKVWTVGKVLDIRDIDDP
uniref:Uncharacterized protein n=1 Tax=Schistosoma haematobium TaxID=6185 RepID=A0A095BYF3_SCHHA